MKRIDGYTDQYFEKFSTKPVQLQPFDPQTKQTALEYMDLLDRERAE